MLLDGGGGGKLTFFEVWATRSSMTSDNAQRARARALMSYLIW
jgi:hypothetical protein